MLTVEMISRIRREHFVKGKTIREISRDLKVSRNTVRKVLRSGGTSFEYEHDVQPRPKLGRWTTELDELLEGQCDQALLARESQATATAARPRVRDDVLEILRVYHHARRWPDRLYPPRSSNQDLDNQSLPWLDQATAPQESLQTP